MKNKLKGGLSLLLATVIWGSTFVAQSVGMDYIGPFTFQAVRCMLAVLVLLPVIAISDKKNNGQFFRKWADKHLWFSGIACGTALFVAANLQQLGILTTSAGKAAFLTAMYIVIVPFIGLFLKRKPGIMAFISVFIAVAGLYLLSCVGITGVNIGDVYLLGSAFVFAVQITLVDHFAPKVDNLRLSCIQSLVCAVFSGILMLFTEQVHFSALLDCWLPLCYAGILSMGIAYTLQILGQRHVEPTAAALIMSLESVFAAISGWLVLHERMTMSETFGCVLVFSAVVLSQLPVRIKITK